MCNNQSRFFKNPRPNYTMSALSLPHFPYFHPFKSYQHYGEMKKKYRRTGEAPVSASVVLTKGQQREENQ